MYLIRMHQGLSWGVHIKPWHACIRDFKINLNRKNVFNVKNEKKHILYLNNKMGAHHLKMHMLPLEKLCIFWCDAGDASASLPYAVMQAHLLTFMWWEKIAALLRWQRKEVKKLQCCCSVALFNLYLYAYIYIYILPIFFL